VRENNQQQCETFREQIRQNRLNIRKQRAEYENLNAQVTAKQAET
jgi:hypothetical protein